MTPDEGCILTAWSQGRAGASHRLAKRAWLVLQDQGRVNPIAVGRAYGSAADAQAWVLAFRALGVAGLVDAPRTGRPASRRDAVAQVVGQLGKVRDVDSRALVRGLSRDDKEAVWRANRLTGVVVERGHRMLDLDVPVPSPLRDLAGLFVSSQLTVIAALERSDQIFDQTRGIWLAVPRGVARPSKQTDLSAGRDLITALNLRIKATASSKADSNASSAQKSATSEARSSASLLARFMERLAQSSGEHPGRMTIACLTSIEAGEPFIQFLSICRRHHLWAPHPRHPSSLKSMTPFAFNGRTSFAFATQAALASLLPSASDEPIGELLDGIRRPRSTPFCWLRAPDLDEGSRDSDWYGTDDEEAI